MHLAEKILLIQPLTFGGDYLINTFLALNRKLECQVPVTIILADVRYKPNPALATKITKDIKWLVPDLNSRVLFAQSVSTLCQRFESRVKTGHRVSCQRPSNLTVVAKSIHLMHPLVQDSDNTDVAVRQPSPIHKMMRLPEVISLYAKFGGHWVRGNSVAFNLIERREEVSDVPIGLLRTPAIARVAVDLVKPQ
jgi:hypothetical protein